MFGKLKQIIKKARHIDDSIESEYYGTLYYPWYDRKRKYDSNVPDIYNVYGEKMDVFFLRDRHLAYNPYMYPMQARYWLWDRYNIGLRTHFYSHWEMLKTMGRPDRRFGFFIESEVIVPQDYELFEKYPGLDKDFDLIFTYSEKLLDKLDNARFAPFCAVPWYTPPADGSGINAYEKKTRMVSILSSDKTMCDLHKFRLDLARQCKRDSLADTFGTFDGGSRVSVADTIKDYRYTIAIENSFSRYFFTERITSAFLAMTVPIYCGTADIGKFFNIDGIITLHPGDDVRKVLSQCSEKDYYARLPAMRDNYQRALKYINPWDMIYEQYLGKKVANQKN